MIALSFSLSCQWDVPPDDLFQQYTIMSWGTNMEMEGFVPLLCMYLRFGQSELGWGCADMVSWVAYRQCNWIIERKKV